MTAQLVSLIKQHFQGPFHEEACENLRSLCASHAQVSIDFEKGDVESYRSVMVTNAVEIEGGTGIFQIRYETGDVVVDFNRAVEMLNGLGIRGYYESNVQDFVYASTHSYARNGGGVIMEWATEGGPSFRAAALHEYVFPLRDFVQ